MSESGAERPTDAEPPKEETEVIVRSADVPEGLQQTVIQVSREAVEKFSREDEVAGYIKKAVEVADGPTWHCIVGISFGSYVAHTRDGFLSFKLRAPNLRGFKEVSLRDSSANDWCYILLFKTS